MFSSGISRLNNLPLKNTFYQKWLTFEGRYSHCDARAYVRSFNNHSREISQPISMKFMSGKCCFATIWKQIVSKWLWTEYYLVNDSRELSL